MQGGSRERPLVCWQYSVTTEFERRENVTAESSGGGKSARQET